MSGESHESQEMYLKTIYVLTREGRTCRAVDIVNELGFAKSSVSAALKHLAEAGMIAVTHGHVAFTEAGLAAAEKIYRRFTVLAHHLEEVGVPHALAVSTACKLEHDIPDEVLAVLAQGMAESET